jgi:hypothetical protein
MPRVAVGVDRQSFTGFARSCSSKAIGLVTKVAKERPGLQPRRFSRLQDL